MIKSIIIHVFYVFNIYSQKIYLPLVSLFVLVLFQASVEKILSNDKPH